MKCRVAMSRQSARCATVIAPCRGSRRAEDRAVPSLPLGVKKQSSGGQTRSGSSTISTCVTRRHRLAVPTDDAPGAESGLLALAASASCGRTMAREVRGGALLPLASNLLSLDELLDWQRKVLRSGAKGLVDLLNTLTGAALEVVTEAIHRLD